MEQNRETTHIQNPCFLAASDYPVLMWRQQAGMYRAYDNPSRVVRVGQPGMADTGMIVPVTITQDMVGKTFGMAVQTEFKTEAGRQSAQQQSWQKAVEAAGGVYLIIRSELEFRHWLDRTIAPQETSPDR